MMEKKQQPCRMQKVLQVRESVEGTSRLRSKAGQIREGRSPKSRTEIYTDDNC